MRCRRRKSGGGPRTEPTHSRLGEVAATVKHRASKSIRKTNYIMGYRLPITDYRLPITNCFYISVFEAGFCENKTKVCKSK